MKPDQERVRNLLTDTVTLLCKNGLIFKEELRIEGLLGVTVDNKESFYVHIGDTFGPSGDKLDRDPVTGDTMKEKEKERPKKKYRGDDSPSHPGASPKSTPSRPSSVSSVSAASSPAQFKVKSEPEDDVSTTDSKGWKRGLQGNDGEPPTKRRLGDSGGNSGDGMGFGLGHGHGHGQMMAGHNNQNPWQDLAAQVSTGPQLGSADIQMAIDSLPGTSQWSSPGGSGGGGAQASSDMMVTSSYMWTNSEGREPLYPSINISSASQRQALKRALVTPVLRTGKPVFAFRIVWRKDEIGRGIVWKNILTKRQMCDEMVKSIKGISMFVSSITGICSRPQKPKIPFVYPAIAYWAVLDSMDMDPRQLTMVLQNSLQMEAEVKLLKEPPLLRDELNMLMVLCMVMKDHSNGYVKNRMAESFAELQHVVPDMGEPVGIVIIDASMSSMGTNAQTVCQAFNIPVTLPYGTEKLLKGGHQSVISDVM